MAFSFPRPQLLGVLLVGAVSLLSCLDRTNSVSSRLRADLDALVAPYVDSYGAPTASIEVSFPKIGKVKLGKLYEKNLTQDSPTVVLTGTALQSDQYYSLITVDPDAPSPTNRSSSNVVHYIVTNIPGSITASQDVKTVGQVVNPWAGPSPPQGIHRYMFLVFEQGYGNINATPYARRLFSVRNFSNTFNLGFPLGSTLFRVAADDAQSN